jgi:hypothetical protein
VRVKRVVLVILALTAFAAFIPATAGAAVPCRDRIYNDWYQDGKIATTYPVACYRDALKNVPIDAKQYSSLADDIRSALQGALARANGQTKVPGQVGTGGAASSPRHEASSKPSTSPHDPTPGQAEDQQQQVSSTLPASTVAVGATGSGGSGLPVPLLVLGGLALLLTAVGAVGLVAKRRRL